MKQKLKEMRVDISLVALLCIAIGLVLMIWPLQSATIIIKVLGIVLIAGGAISIIAFVMSGGLGSRLIAGVVFLILGIWIFTTPLGIMVLISIVIGIVMLVHGIQDLSLALDMKKHGYVASTAPIVIAVITIVLAVILLLNGLFAWELGIRLVGFCLLFDGATDLFVALKTNKNTKEKKRHSQPIDVEYKETDI